MSEQGSRRRQPVAIDGNSLTVERVVRVARESAGVVLADDARGRMSSSRASLDRLLDEGAVIYAVNTGVGDLVSSRIPKKDLRTLQLNLLRSHACGVGEPYPEEVVRAMMLLRANALAKGYSGVRPDVPEALVRMLNARVHPVIPRQGSVGSSGDLAMLAHLGLVIVGEGEADAGSGVEPGGAALKRKGLEPLSLEPKEAISLINGTQAMTALGILAVRDAANLADNAQVAAAMSLDALKGTNTAFDPRVSKVRPHAGQVRVAGNMTALLGGSEIMLSHRHCSKVQDAYTLRCIPQVIGASLGAIWYAEDVVGVEMNSATDNPLFFPDDSSVISAGNFHGQPVALAMDFLGLAVHELGSFSERRVARMVDHKLSGLPAFLTKHGGLSSGMMVPQYVAASLVAEDMVLVHPASATSIPTSANQEDHNSMGTIGAWKARQIIENVTKIVAIEMIASAQAMDFMSAASSACVEEVRAAIRSKVKRLDKDRSMTKDIDAVASMIRSGELAEIAEHACDFQRT